MPDAVHSSVPHDSAQRHVAGTAIYADDVPEPKNLLHLAFGQSPHAHARIVSINLDAVRAAPGVVAVLTAADIPGANNVAPVFGDDQLLATEKVIFVGQPVFLVAANSAKAARMAAKLGEVVYEPLPAILTIAQARAAQSILEPAQVMVRGDMAALDAAPHRISGKVEMGGQDHFYLEGQIAIATPGEGGAMHILSSTQHPSEIQHLVAHMLHSQDRPVMSADVTVEVRRMGGGFGGKETQAALFAAAAALVADKTGRPAKFRADRDDDMVMTGKRHDFEAEFDVAFDDDGRIRALRLELASRCGCSADLSLAINDRAMFHADNCYHLPNVEIVSHRYKTHTVSNTAFRGFGGPQGMLAIERVMDAIAAHLGRDAVSVRQVNFYRPGDRTPYGMEVTDFVADCIISELLESSNYAARKMAIESFNATHPYLKRGIALTPVKFGISFTTTHLNQAGALVHLYADGSIGLNHGGTEMGQGLNTKVAQIVADVFGVGLDVVRITATRTDKVPNTSATAASSGTDLNGMAAWNAAQTLRGRLVEFLGGDVVFKDGKVTVGNQVYDFGHVCRMAHMGRVSLSATGFYATPKIHYDRKSHTGRPFLYFAYGAAVSEVVIDTLTGESRVVRADLLHDAGRSINPALDLGQVEGAYVQGLGWLMTEELVWDDKGRLLTHAPSTYKIPCASDRPEVMNVHLWQAGENREPTIHRSKAVGEPPFMLALSVLSALTHAVQQATGRPVITLDAPATPERILAALRHG
ncbi:xanthine dehydrogenase, molybdopterin binding subunit [Asticcacaulis biprosthecium C19]|uniref:Xanthine dehydrogenase, molybdopterin binding subunit n=1 Tax=Asticcacaulis biprosthecium C19 TaxID=715226 RepID=F4QN23_9CAUL|nr:xanthine dehydrogenase molybdopterin binding subunit [Asticcacaulis biprosthecium]EGF91614.1 xanthine dehydrogenase, molybdopterin binding subunit [Asticcacaulis biprosthecium C19]